MSIQRKFRRKAREEQQIRQGVVKASRDISEEAVLFIATLAGEVVMNRYGELKKKETRLSTFVDLLCRNIVEPPTEELKKIENVIVDNLRREINGTDKK